MKPQRSLRTSSFVNATVAVLLSACGTCGAQTQTQDDDWHVTIAPYLWASSLGGDASLAGFHTHVDIPTSEIISHLDYALMGELEVRKGRFGLLVDAMHSKTSQDERVYSQALALDITKTHLHAAAFYRAYEHDLGGATYHGQSRQLTIDPLIGLRWSKLEAGVSALGRYVKKNSDWLEPTIGVRVNADLNPRWLLTATGEYGGFEGRSKESFDISASLGYRVNVGRQPLLVRGGYRVLSQDYETGDFTGNQFRWHVDQRGPFVGVSMLF